MASKTREELDKLLDEFLPPLHSFEVQHLLDDLVDEAFDRGLIAGYRAMEG